MRCLNPRLRIPTATSSLQTPRTASARSHSPEIPDPAPPSPRWRCRLGKSSDCSPLASPPHAASIPLPARGPASAAVANCALCRQSASREPIPDLFSAGGGTFLPPGRLMDNQESEAPPPASHRDTLPAPGQDCSICPSGCPPNLVYNPILVLYRIRLLFQRQPPSTESYL